MAHAAWGYKRRSYKYNLEFQNQSIGTVPKTSAGHGKGGQGHQPEALNIDTTGPGIELLLKLQLEKLAYPCVGN